jgi:hypothetical protein
MRWCVVALVDSQGYFFICTALLQPGELFGVSRDSWFDLGTNSARQPRPDRQWH